jgi:hypothetical protein
MVVACLFCSGKVAGQIGTINLTKSSIGIDTITVVEKPYQAGDLTMSQNQYKILPASFQDPARILIKYPGFSTPNDGANAIVFRGMAPEMARWQLFGADIVNPNHLSNAGTADDLATNFAGGVNALNGSVLDYYHFEANPAEISYADALSGISDMKLAPQIKSYFDLNLIGIEAGINYDLDKDLASKKRSFYASYRYSFVGLLQQLGLEFGNEKIGYQDLTIYGDVLKGNNHHFKAFCTLGSSSNTFYAASAGDSITRFKDFQDIFFKSKLGIGGLQMVINKEKSMFQSTLVYSMRNNERRESTNERHLLQAGGLSYVGLNDQMESLLSSHSFIQFYHKNSISKAGLRVNVRPDYVNNNLSLSANPIVDFYPYFSYAQQFRKLYYQVGIATFFNSFSDVWTVEPAASLKYAWSNSLKIELDGRLASMQFYPDQNRLRIKNESRIKSQNVQASLQYNKNNFSGRATTFYHFLQDIPNFYLSNSPQSGHFNFFNGSNLGYDRWNEDVFFTFRSLTTARVFGVDLFLENSHHVGSNTLNYFISGSIFDANYTQPEPDKLEYDGKYNYGYTVSPTLMYMVNLANGEKNRNFSVSMSYHRRGGQREQRLASHPMNFSGSIYDYTSPFANRLKSYSRLDFRLVYAKGKKSSKYRQRWSFDIQNILNTENDGFKYYDSWLRKVVLQSQLGLIPVISYRLEW